jgi:predicted RNase H-like nuclease (RuvC/YqgF family)
MAGLQELRKKIDECCKIMESQAQTLDMIEEHVKLSNIDPWKDEVDRLSKPVDSDIHMIGGPTLAEPHSTIEQHAKKYRQQVGYKTRTPCESYLEEAHATIEKLTKENNELKRIIVNLKKRYVSTNDGPKGTDSYVNKIYTCK